MNLLGKGMVFVQLAGSVIALACAAGIYLQKLDWGWKEPRKDLDVRVASEIDKRAAAVREAHNAIALVYPAVKPGRDALADAEPRFPENHLWYLAELERLRSAEGKIDIKEIKYADGEPVLDTPGKLTGKPVLEDLVPNLDQSYEGYLADLKKLGAQMDAVTKSIGNLIEQEEKLTFLLNGRDDTGKVVKTGLLELRDREYQAQTAAKEEMAYLRPMWAQSLAEAATFRDRRVRLQQTLDRLTQPPPTPQDGKMR